MKIKALALDLDGTLTDSRKEVTERTCLAVGAAIGAGIKIILASGRPLIGIKGVADRLRLFELGGYIMACNGGQVVDCLTGELVFERLLPIGHYAAICGLARKHGLSALTYDGDGIVTEDESAEYVLREAYNNALPIRKVPRLEDEIREEVVKFMVVGEPGRISGALGAFRAALGDGVNVFLSEPYFMELTSKGIDKAYALEKLAGHLGISRGELCGIGDGHNDAPMLEYAGLAVAMDNACEEIKSIADFVTLSNDEDGVAEFIFGRLLGSGGI